MTPITEKQADAIVNAYIQDFITPPASNAKPIDWDDIMRNAKDLKDAVGKALDQMHRNVLDAHIKKHEPVTDAQNTIDVYKHLKIILDDPKVRAQVAEMLRRPGKDNPQFNFKLKDGRKVTVKPLPGVSNKEPDTKTPLRVTLQHGEFKEGKLKLQDKYTAGLIALPEMKSTPENLKPCAHAKLTSTNALNEGARAILAAVKPAHLRTDPLYTIDMNEIQNGAGSQGSTRTTQSGFTPSGPTEHEQVGDIIKRLAYESVNFENQMHEARNRANSWARACDDKNQELCLMDADLKGYREQIAKLKATIDEQDKEFEELYSVAKAMRQLIAVQKISPAMMGKFKKALDGFIIQTNKHRKAPF